MAEDKNKFQSIYGDAESEFETEDVSDETLSISREEIEAAVADQDEQPAPAAEKAVDEPVAAEETAPEEKAAPAEETAPEEQAAPAREETPVEEPASAETTSDAETSAPAKEEPKAEEPAKKAPAATERVVEEKTPKAVQEEIDDEDDATSGFTFGDRAYEDHAYEDHEYHSYHDDDPDDVYSDKDDEGHEDEKVGIISYILHAILFTIPVIGTIVMLVYIISDKKNSHLRHFAQIWLVTLLLIAIGAYAAITILGIA